MFEIALIFPHKPVLATAFTSVNDSNLPSISLGQILRAILDFSVLLSHPISATPADSVFKTHSRANHFSPTSLPPPSPKLSSFLPGLLLLPPNYFPSSIPCPSIVNSQYSRQSYNRFYKSSQAHSSNLPLAFHLIQSES